MAETMTSPTSKEQPRTPLGQDDLEALDQLAAEDDRVEARRLALEMAGQSDGRTIEVIDESGKVTVIPVVHIGRAAVNPGAPSPFKKFEKGFVDAAQEQAQADSWRAPKS